MKIPFHFVPVSGLLLLNLWVTFPVAGSLNFFFNLAKLMPSNCWSGRSDLSVSLLGCKLFFFAFAIDSFIKSLIKLPSFFSSSISFCFIVVCDLSSALIFFIIFAFDFFCWINSLVFFSLVSFREIIFFNVLSV